DQNYPHATSRCFACWCRDAAKQGNCQPISPRTVKQHLRTVFLRVGIQWNIPVSLEGQAALEGNWQAFSDHHRWWVMLSRNTRSLSASAAGTARNSMPTPNPGRLLATIASSQSFSCPSHSPTLRRVSFLSGIGISTKQPPRLKSETLPQMGAPCDSACSSTEFIDLSRACRRRSLLVPPRA